MLNNTIRNSIYFIVFVVLQVLLFNQISFFKVATPFLYIYFILKLPEGTSRSLVVFYGFLTGLSIDIFSNTPGMHAAAATFAGLVRYPLIKRLTTKDMVETAAPSFYSMGAGGYTRYVVFFVLLHHAALLLIESFTLFDPLYLIIRILASSALTIILLLAIEGFNYEVLKSEE
ncbi:MAG TPA: rod shape-determining protein MreD [Porphyromonadaceae bacterium]|nr:rod shape-determining protein MreD [Porphyromonadaceae bacterium]